MFTILINNSLSTPAIFAITRRIDNLKVEISPDIDGFEIISPDEVTVTGTTRRELMLALRDLVR